MNQPQDDVNAEDREVLPQTDSSEALARPGLASRAATRFASVYFTLLLFPWPISALFVSDRLQRISDLLVYRVARAWEPLVDFAAASIFHVGRPVVVLGDTGSSDRLFDWLVNFWVLVIATAVTAIWTAVRPNDAGRTSAYLRVYLRYTLGAILLTYGSLKLSQFPPPFNSVLNNTFGEETRMGLLWAFIGASTGYTVCIGLLELICGALLLFRRTAVLGACIAAALTLNIFLLNVFYDVPVKLFSFHLLLASMILLAPDLGRLASLFLLNQPVPSRPEKPGAQPAILRTLKVVFVVSLFGWDTVAAIEGYAKRTAPKLPIEGIWKVAGFSQYGHEVSDSKPFRWQWLTIDKFGRTAFCHLWRVDGSTASGPLSLDRGYVLTLPGTGRSQSWKVQALGNDELAVSGVLSGVETSIQLRRDEDWTLPLRSKAHWIQESPREP